MDSRDNEAAASAATELLTNDDNTPAAVASTSASSPIDTTSSDHEVVCLDLSAEYPTDRAHFPSRVSDELRNLIVNFGPCRPKGPFPVNEEFGRRSFSEKNYHATSGGITIQRLWLCFSPQLNRPYCQSCWLFGDQSAQQKEWIDGVPGNPNHYGIKIKSHENTVVHRIACSALAQWKAGEQIDREHQKTIQTEVTFWRRVLLRVINIMLTLATMSLAFRGHRKSIGDKSCYGGNFLALVAMQARFDPVLEELLQTPARKTKYLSPKIQNELIQVVSDCLRNRLLAKLRNCAFYSIIVDTTSDITRADQVSIVLRWVSIECEVVTIKETFVGFVHTMVSTAQGLAELGWCIMDWTCVKSGVRDMTEPQ